MEFVYSGDESRFDRDGRGFRYYRNAVERHWDPHEIDIEVDVERLADADQATMDVLRRSLALFGAGEQAVTEDLAPLAVVIEDPADALFITTQLYEEAKHADLFDRYWTTVVNPVEESLGLEQSGPMEPRWFNDDYVELFDRNEAAMARLLEEDTPETRARALCHYHLTIEGILAQTGYYGLTRAYSDDAHHELPHLPGLVEGLRKIRSDEGRHVGWGMAKLKELVETGAINPSLLSSTVSELVPLVQGTVAPPEEDRDVGPTPAELTEYATEKHTERLRQITQAGADIPDVSALTSLEG